MNVSTRKCFAYADTGNINELRKLADQGLDLASMRRKPHSRYYQDDDNDTLLTAAARAGHNSIVNYFLTTSFKGRKIFVDAENDKSETALHVALEKRHYDVVKALLEHGANVNVSTEDGYTPFGIAASSGRLDLVNLLLFYNPNINVAYTYGDGTPLRCARLRMESAARSLAEHRYLQPHQTALIAQRQRCLKSYDNYSAIVKILLERGAIDSEK